MSIISAPNYVANPEAEIDTSGWVAGTNVTIARVTSLPTTSGLPPGVDTGFSVTHDVGTSGGQGAAHTALTVDASGDHTFSAYVYIPSGWTGGEVRLTQFGWAGIVAAPNQAANMATRDAWQRVAYEPLTIDAGDLTGSLQFVVATSWTAGEALYFTAVLMAAGSTAPVYSRQLSPIPVLKIGSSHIGPLRVGERN